MWQIKLAIKVKKRTHTSEVTPDSTDPIGGK
jgi:hypothetical protein